jgi:hypothetical protein
MPDEHSSNERLRVESAEGCLWIVAAIVLPFAIPLGPTHDAVITFVELLVTAPIVVGVVMIGTFSVLTWLARVDPGALTIRVWVLWAWSTGLLGISIGVALAIDNVIPSSAYLLVGMVRLFAWIVIALVVSPIVMGVSIALASRAFVRRTLHMDRRLTVSVGVALLVYFALALNQTVRPAQLAAMEEARLVYPGSVLLKEGRAPAFDGSPAMYDATYISDSPLADVKAFYREHFRARPGWVPDASTRAMTSTTEVASCTWHNGSVTLRIGFPEEREWLRRRDLEGRPGVRPGATLYEIVILDKVSGSAGRHTCS